MKQFLRHIFKGIKASKKNRKHQEVKYRFRQDVSIWYRPGGY